MGEKSTIPVLQMIFALLALSECLPISGGGSPGSLPHPSRNTQSWSQQTAKASRQNELNKVWIPETSYSLEHVKHLPADTPSGVKHSNKETLYSHKGNGQSEIMLSSSMSANTREFQSEDSNSNHKAKLNFPTKTNGDKVLMEEDGSIGGAGNVTIVIMKNKRHRDKRSFTRITMGDLDNRIIPNLAAEVLDIAYTHVVPCVFADRFYCLNGGTCVFVGALDIKTCR